MGALEFLPCPVKGDAYQCPDQIHADLAISMRTLHETIARYHVSILTGSKISVISSSMKICKLDNAEPTLFWPPGKLAGRPKA